MPYKFRLQKLLDIRLENEEKSKMKFKLAQYEKITAEKKLDNLQNDYLKYSAQRCNNIAEEKLRHIYLNLVSDNIKKVKIELKEKIKILDEKRNELKESQIERKTVEILKDKKVQAYVKEQEYTEQRVNDELALYAFIKNTNKSL